VTLTPAEREDRRLKAVKQVLEAIASGPGTEAYWLGFAQGATAIRDGSGWPRTGGRHHPVPLDQRQGRQNGMDWQRNAQGAHADYPHEPGRLNDCPACQAQCHCTAGTTDCVFVGEHTIPAGGPAAETVTDEILRVGQENGWTVTTRAMATLEAAVSAERGRQHVMVLLTATGAVKMVMTGHLPVIEGRDKRAQVIAYLRAAQ
jgi:hypothetical protein